MKSTIKRGKRLQLIACPFCGYEYLPEDIYIPKYLLTHSEITERNEKGQIEWVYGELAQKRESYECDNCGKKFYVKCVTGFFSLKDEGEEEDD